MRRAGIFSGRLLLITLTMIGAVAAANTQDANTQVIDASGINDDQGVVQAIDGSGILAIDGSGIRSVGSVGTSAIDGSGIYGFYHQLLRRLGLKF